MAVFLFIISMCFPLAKLWNNHIQAKEVDEEKKGLSKDVVGLLGKFNVSVQSLAELWRITKMPSTIL